MLDKKNSNLELEKKLKVLELERKLKEIKQKQEKIEDRLVTVIMTFIFCAGAGLFLFFSKTKVESWIIPSFGILAVIFLLFWLILYNDFKKKKKRIEELERELYLLKKGLKKED